MKAKTFDRQFEAGEDMTDALDVSRAKRVLQTQKRVNVDGCWTHSTDRQASWAIHHQGVARRAA